jgi:hypothetical protein
MDKLERFSSPLSRRRVLQTTFAAAGAALFCGLILQEGCGASSHLVPQRGEVFLPGAARVVLMGVEKDIVSLEVYNQTPAQLTIYRDSFLLSTPSGLRARQPGGVSNVYVVRPGGVHAVRLRFDLSGLHRGDQIALILQNALVVNGQPLPMEAIPFSVQ